MNEKNASKGKSKWFILASSFIVVFAILISVFFYYDSQKEYIDGNILNLPYVNQWNEEDLLDNPWNNVQFYMGLMYRNLLVSDSSFEEVECDLAESYAVSTDGLEYSITLKEDVLWSDGEPMTIDDVIFSIEAVLQSQTANGFYTTAFAKIEGYEEFIENADLGLSGIEKTGENSIVIHLSVVHPTMLQVLAQFVILPEHAFSCADYADLDADDYWKDPVVSGMYKVGEVVSYETVQLVRNEYYNETEPNIDEVMLYMNYKFANLDYYSTNNITEIINYRSMRSMTEYKVDLLFYRYFVFNVVGTEEEESSGLEDANVRKAIALAIDRASLLYDIYLDSGTLIETGVPSYHASYSGEVIEYDPEEAIALLAETEYDFSRPLRLAYYYTDATSVAFIEAVAEYLEAVGFEVEIKYLSTSTELYDDREYDILLKGLSAFDVSEYYMEYNDDNANLSRLLGCDTIFDTLTDSLSTVTDAEEEDALLKELQELEQEYFYKIPLFTLSQVVYINDDRVEIPDNVTFGNTWYKYDVDYENWSIKKE